MVSAESKQSLRICFFNRSYHPDFGATGQLLTELAEDLVQKYGCRVTVVAGPPSRSEQRRGVEIRRAWGTAFRPARFAGRVFNYLTYFSSACLAGCFIQKPNVVVALTDPPIIGLSAWLAARRSGARFVLLCQDLFPEVASLAEEVRSPLANRLLQRISRFLVHKADRLIAVGETMRERLITGKGADRNKVQVIHNWADCTAITPAAKKNPFSLANGLADSFVVMHSGNIGLSQNLETLVEAAARLRSFPDIRVVFVGDGVKKEALEARARELGLENVRFLPYQPKEKLKDSFASADLFVISLKKGLAGAIVPSKLYGILAAGRPYVAAVEEPCEVSLITRQAQCGLLAKPEDPNDLAQKILTLYQDRLLAKRLGENARQAALSFDRPRAVQAYYNLFQELC